MKDIFLQASEIISGFQLNVKQLWKSRLVNTEKIFLNVKYFGSQVA